jgi:hypothetical protein
MAMCVRLALAEKLDFDRKVGKGTHICKHGVFNNLAGLVEGGRNSDTEGPSWYINKCSGNNK